MAEISINTSSTGGALQTLLMSDDIEPGSEASYQVCKAIYLYHPLGRKIVEKPLQIAMCTQRMITVPASPGDHVRDAFTKEWNNLKADGHIFNVMRISRIYGTAAVIYGAPNIATTEPIEPKKLPDLDIYFNVYDPLNTSGSLVLNLDPNSPDFLKHRGITAAGQPYARSRSCVIFNEDPIYLAYTSSAFGFVGRSVYQRALFPLKSFVSSMITDDMVTRKAGLLIVMIKQVGSIVNKVMNAAAGIKRGMLKEGQTDNVLTIGHEDKIETLNMTNTDTAMTTARKNILENIASAAPMPAQMLNSDTFAEGFGEGTEDAKAAAQFVDGIREEMQPLYDFFDPIVMYRAWSPAFYETMKAQFPEIYGNMEYDVAFNQWRNSFTAEWPSLLKESDSELAKVDDVKLKAIVGLLEALLPVLDPENKAIIIQTALDNVNSLKLLFPEPFELDMEALAAYVPPTPTMEPKPGSEE